MAGYNQEFCSWLLADDFAFSFGQNKSVRRSLTFKVSAYSRGQLIGEEIRQNKHLMELELKCLVPSWSFVQQTK